MLAALARLAIRRRRLVLVGALVAFLVFGAIGGGVAEKLSSGGFDDKSSENYRANQLLEDVFNQGDPNLVLVVTGRNGDVDDPAVATAGTELTNRLAGMEQIQTAVSYWTLGNAPPLKGRNGDKALVIARIAGDEDEVDSWIEENHEALGADTDVIEVGVTGFAEVFRQIGTTIQEDLAKAESIAIPITMLLLVLVFGGVVAAGLPIGIGILSIVGTFFILFVLSKLTQVSVFSINLTTAMGFGLAIDYSLFVVSRYREELRKGRTIEAAIERTVQTAGRTVVFSALTVAASLAALLVFPLAFLRSFAYAGIAVVAVGALASVLVLPAALAALGPRIDKWSIFKRQPKEVGEGFWHRMAMTVMRRPVVFAVSVTALLIVLGLPFLNVRLGLPDDRVMPADAPARVASDDVRANFESREAFALSVVATGIGDPAARAPEIEAYATELSKLPGVSRVDASTGFYAGGQRLLGPTDISARFVTGDSTYLSVVPGVEPISGEGERLVEQIRTMDAPFPVQVSGGSAQLVDTKEAIFNRLPLALGIIGVITFTVLFLMFGSILVPVKAVVLNLLSLTATFGAMVWIFQEGHFAGILDFTPTGMIDITTPILMFCIAFGLSMDYEVFLLSRIKEEHDRTGDNEHAVAAGLEHTGRIVTAAAALLAVVFIAMASSGIAFIKLFGLGLTMAVLMDATLIRAVLVPAFMRLAGEANWWAPAPMKRFYERYGFSAEAADDDNDVVIPDLPPDDLRPSPVGASK
jgi:putative drug exporter of the RND superfamily